MKRIPRLPQETGYQVPAMVSARGHPIRQLQGLTPSKDQLVSPFKAFNKAAGTIEVIKGLTSFLPSTSRVSPVDLGDGTISVGVVNHLGKSLSPMLQERLVLQGNRC